MNKPNTFIVGAPKCGTTALYTYLAEHPHIFMSPIKEPDFFAQDFLGEQRRVRTLPEYLKCFAGARNEEIIGEASTSYFASKLAPNQIKAFSPNAHIIIMLRNPVDKMYSRFIEARISNKEAHESFEEALETEKRYGPSSGLGYMESARYTCRVRKYLETFGRQSIHIIIYDDFKDHTAEIYQDTLRFLGLSPDGRSEFSVVNRSRYVRSTVLHQLVRHPPNFLRTIGRAAMPQGMRKRLRGWLSRLNMVSTPPPPLKPALRYRLQAQFEDDVNDLEQLIGRDLSHWLRR
jgi:hypothetical protein